MHLRPGGPTAGVVLLLSAVRLLRLRGVLLLVVLLRMAVARVLAGTPVAVLPLLRVVAVR
ncbi:hypothetical protein [Streptomyces cadmiisoli]|uniref:hypothetical protein n=1 Tax=Streptomyces cadmiisoli TaxID=2184053 RepID=UPI003D71C00A